MSIHLLEPSLKFIKAHYDNHHHDLIKHHQNYVDIIPVEPEVQDIIEFTVTQTDLLVEHEWTKVERFIKWKLSELIHCWKQMVSISIDYEQEEETSHEVYIKKGEMKESIKIIYANAIYLS